MTFMNMARAMFLSIFALGSAAAASAQDPCGWSNPSLSFAGSDEQQATCLLRRVVIGGHLQAQPLPPAIATRVGRSAAITDRQFQRAIDAFAPDTRNALAATAGQSVSHTAAGQPAPYFVIHDTSTPYLADAPFPADIDTSRSINRLDRYDGGSPKAHIFVNRVGAILVGHDLSVPWRATKLETQRAGTAARGRLLHIELVQPRRRDLAGSRTNDRFSPSPGFSAAQYRALASLYVIASRRAGRWLIPAFHAAIDAGFSDAHDDPQGFDLQAFAASIDAIMQGGSEPAVAVVSEPVNPPPEGSLPALRWGSGGDRLSWTQSLQKALDAHGAPLV